MSALSLGQLAGLACLWEATASKPGNVHRAADFEDVTFVDFAVSALAIQPVFDRAAPGARLGEIVLDAISATRQAVGTNTNLGTVLLLAPLAIADEPIAAGVARVVHSLDQHDATLVYDAIRLAQPGGMGHVEKADVSGPPPDDLLAAMRLAADRDLVARQYVNNFAEVLEVVVPAIGDALGQAWPLGEAIVHAQLRLMSQFPDSLIARKCGPAVARQSAAMAAAALAAGRPGDEAYHRTLADFDFWLRADGHRRNPGTTADLIAAGLFTALRQGIIKLPVRFYATT
ncbi:MAG TPA: triphosphoribosyl-dephospho-CoA synthase [Pirellulales bacterium]|nr:triphosphoribosyl-dephospho-CoA synthase [Pirellulales bacterium]